MTRLFFGMLVSFLVLTSVAVAQSTKKSNAELEKTRQEMIAKAIAFLRTTQQEDGSFWPTPQSVIGPTGIVLIGLLQAGVPADDPMVKKGIEFLKKYVHEDGSFSSPGVKIINYETCVAICALSLANKGGEYSELLKKADAFIRGQQYTEKSGHSKDDPNYGGLGYGLGERADLSNTEIFVEAIRLTGGGADDEAVQRALVFVSRCQNLPSEHNPSPKAAKNPDGGFYYTAEDGGGSSAGETANGGLRSYGSMTYSGFKSMVYAGLTPSDPRFQAAEKWLKENYDLNSNPGMGLQGLYYYYQLISKTLDVAKMPEFVTADNQKHDWKAELIELFALRQNKDGSWINPQARWLEGDPNLVTGYVLMTLSNCKKN